MRRSYLFAGAIILLISLSSTISFTQAYPSPIKVFITGGVGCNMGVINDGNEAIIANCSITYWNMGNHHIETTFYVPPYSAVEKTFPIFSIFSPITASIRASNEGLTKNGYVFLFFVIFPE